MIEANKSNSWLFTNGEQSVHIVRMPPTSLMVHGPGASRKRHDFTGEGALQAYQVSIAEQLADRGWTLIGVDYDRRSPERRAEVPGASDRRQYFPLSDLENDLDARSRND